MGLVVNTRSLGTIVRVQPTSKGPDNFCCLVATTFEFNGMVGAGSVWGEEGSVQKSTGLLMDASEGGISGNKVLVQEINACNIGIELTQGCHGNHVDVTWIHLTSLGIKIGNTQAPDVSAHVIQATVSGDLPQASGLQFFGRRNFLTINAHSHDSGRNIIFEEPAHDNLIVATNLPNGITNLAKTSTHRIIPCWPIGFNIPTPNFPTSGETVINEQAYQIEVLILTSGNVSSWRLTDANGNTQTICGGLFTGQCLILEPGDQIQFIYTMAPEWRWRVLR